jgi:spore coat-associated protein N
MGVKLKLSLGIASLILGISLLGGTFAFFTDTEVITENKIEAGTLGLTHDKVSSVIFNVTDMVPGTTSTHELSLINNGNINITKVLLGIIYSSREAGTTDNPIQTVTNRKELYDDIKIEITDHTGSITLSEKKSLAELGILTVPSINLGSIAKSGLLPIKIKLSYEGSNVNQNHQMGDSVNITFTFEATTQN